MLVITQTPTHADFDTDEFGETGQVTNSMNQVPSWHANGFLDSQEILRIYEARKFINAFTRTRHVPEPEADQSSPWPHPFHFSTTHFNIILSSISSLPSGLFHSDFLQSKLRMPLGETEIKVPADVPCVGYKRNRTD